MTVKLHRKATAPAILTALPEQPKEHAKLLFSLLLQRTRNEKLCVEALKAALRQSGKCCIGQMYAYANSHLHAVAENNRPRAILPGTTSSVLENLVLNGLRHEDLCRTRGISRTEMMRELRAELKKLR